MSQAYKAPNGEILIAQDDIQAYVMIKAGWEPVDTPKRIGRPPKTEE